MRNGSITVELALVVPLLLFLLFSIIELGFLVSNRTQLGQASREASRTAVVGGTLAQIDAAVNSNIQTAAPQNLQRTYQFRTWNADTGDWDHWQTLGDDGSANGAPRGSQISVELEFAHGLLVPGIMGPVLGADGNGQVRLTAGSVMMRE